MVYFDEVSQTYKDNGLPNFSAILGDLVGPTYGFDIGPNDFWLSKINSQDAYDYAKSKRFESLPGVSGADFEAWKAGVSSPELAKLYAKQKSGGVLTPQEQSALNDPISYGRQLVAAERARYDAAGGDSEGGLGGIMTAFTPFLVGLGAGGIGSMLSGVGAGAAGTSGAGMLGGEAGLYGLELGGAGVGAADLGLGYAAGAGAAGGSAMDWTDVLGDWPSYGGESSSGMFDYQSALNSLQEGVANGTIATEDAMKAMEALNNYSTNGGWGEFLNTGAIGDPSTAMSMMQRLQSMGLSPTDALKAVQSAMSGGDSIAGRMLSGGLGAIGGALTGNAAVDAAKIKAQSDLATAQLAADQAKFKPYGMTTFAGQSNFIKDAQGNVIGAGYTAAPWAKSQQDALLGMSVDALDQYRAAPGMFAPMGTAGQRAMSLGNQYLATDPQAQAQKYMNDQQALLATGRERDMNQMLTGEFNRGTYGLGVGATSTGMGAANPRMEAMLNAQRQQDLGLAAQATQGGMDYAKFGTGMVGLGGDLTKGMFAGQTAAFDPYKTALGGASTIEGLAQQPLTLGADLGKANMNTGAASLLMQGGLSANQANQNAGSFSPWGNLLSGAANQVSNYQNQQQQQQQQQQLLAAMTGKTWGST